MNKLLLSIILIFSMNVGAITIEKTSMTSPQESVEETKIDEKELSPIEEFASSKGFVGFLIFLGIGLFLSQGSSSSRSSSSSHYIGMSGD